MKAEFYESAVSDQQALCKKYGAEYLRSSLASKLGISQGVLSGVLPIHGLRHQPKAGTCGWYIWSGDYSDHVDFFEPLHVEHVFEEQMLFARYLGLAPGWRFLIGEKGHEDVWFDANLLNEVK
jgi:hypothetical protein